MLDSFLWFVGYNLVFIYLIIQKMIDFIHGKLIFVKVIDFFSILLRNKLHTLLEELKPYGRMI